LAKNEVHTAFVLFAKRAGDEFNVAVGRYAIMPDHVPLFLRGSHKFRLGAWIGALKQTLAKAGMLSRAKGQVWQEGFSIIFCEAMRATRKSGITFGRISYAPDW